MRLRVVITLTCDYDVSDDPDVRERLFDERDLSDTVRAIREELKTGFSVAFPDCNVIPSKVEVNVWQRPNDAGNDYKVQDITRKNKL